MSEVADITTIDWSFYPSECNVNDFTQSKKDALVSKFETQCKGSKTCQFSFNNSDLDESCTLPQANTSNWQYVLVAKCSSSSILFGENEVKVTKNVIAIVVVIFDLIITFYFWCSMLALNKIQLATEREINAGTVTPSDFTVVVTTEPHTEKLEDLPAVFYAWAENINSQETDELID